MDKIVNKIKKDNLDGSKKDNLDRFRLDFFFVRFSGDDSNRDILKYIRDELYQKEEPFFNNNHKNEKEFLKIYENFLEISKALQGFFENKKIKKLFENRKTKELEELFKELKRHETLFTITEQEMNLINGKLNT